MSTARRRTLPDSAVLALWMLGIAVALLGLQLHRTAGTPPPGGAAKATGAQTGSVTPTPPGVADTRLGILQNGPAQLTSVQLPTSQTPGRLRAGFLAAVVVLLVAGFWSKRRVLDIR